MNGCAYCKDRPLRNAAQWTMAGADPFAPCPRCGGVGDPAQDAEIELRFARENMRRFLDQERALGRPLSAETRARAVALGVLDPVNDRAAA